MIHFTLIKKGKTKRTVALFNSVTKYEKFSESVSFYKDITI